MNKDMPFIALLENSNSCHLERGREGKAGQRKGTKRKRGRPMTSHTLAKLTKIGQTKSKWPKI